MILQSIQIGGVDIFGALPGEGDAWAEMFTDAFGPIYLDRIVPFRGTQISQVLDGAIGTAELDLIATRELSNVTGQEIIILDQSGKRAFAGYVSNRSVHRMTRDFVLSRLRCQDYTVELNNIAIEYELFASRTASSVLAYLFEKYAPAWNAMSNVLDTGIVENLTLKNTTLLDALSELKKRTGASWYADYTRNLHWFSEGDLKAGYDISDWGPPADDATVTLFGDADSLFGSTQLFGGGSTAMQRLLALRSSFDYEEEFTNRANKVRVIGGVTPDQNFVTNLTVPLSTDNGYVKKRGSGFPPSDPYTIWTVQTGTEDLIVGAENEGSGFYHQYVAMLRFDTSVIPTTASIESVTLKLYGTYGYSTGQQPLSDIQFGVEDYDWAYWPIAEDDWTSSFSNSFGAETFVLKNSGVRQWYSFPLYKGVLNRVGYTGFRLHLKVESPPSRPMLFTFGGRDAVTGDNNPPVLQIAYRVRGSQIEYTAEDATSQAAYGTHEKTIYESGVLNQAEAQQIAENEVLQYANPRKSGAILVRSDTPQLGDQVRVNLFTLGIDDEFLIREKTVRWWSARYSVTALGIGDARPDLVDMIRKMQTKIGKI